MPKDRLNISFQSMPATIDPRTSSDFISATLICLLFEGLTRCKPNNELQMALAKQIEISSDQRRYTFYIKDAYWSDGKKISASDFEMSWKTILDPTFPSPSAYLFYPILNAKKASQGLVSLDTVGIRSMSDTVLEVTLEQPTPYFLSLTAFPAFLPIPSHASHHLKQWLQNPELLVTNGPFRLHTINAQSHLLLKKNLTFWNAEKVKLSSMQIAIVQNETTALQMFLRNELDWIGGALSPIPVDSLEKLKPSLQFSPVAATTFCAFQTKHPLLHNRDLRIALSLAIDKEAIVEKITQMKESPGSRLIPPSLCNREQKHSFCCSNPGLAQEYLNKALSALQLHRQELCLTLSYRSSQTDKRIAQALQRQWKELLGIDVLLKEHEPSLFKELLHKRDFEMALSFWIAQFSDPINILERFIDRSNWKNYSAWYDPVFEETLKRAIREPNLLQRELLLEKAEAILANDMPLCPIYHWSNPSLCQPNIFNIEATANGGILFEYCEKRPS